MPENNNLSEIEIQDQKIIANTELSLIEALVPVIALMAMLAYNIFFASGELLGGYSNQYILLIAGFIAAERDNNDCVVGVAYRSTILGEYTH